MKDKFGIIWRVEKRPLAHLKLWDKNPRTITEEAYNKLKDRIVKRGFHDVIKIDTDGTILSGNQRKRACEELGITEVYAAIPNRKLTDGERNTVALESNRNDGEWDWDKLANEFDEAMLADIGFDHDALESAFDNGEAEEDEAPEPPAEPKSKLGEVYELGRHRLMCGDATKREDVEKLMNGKKLTWFLLIRRMALGVMEGEKIWN